ncbi:hypothetical protein BH20VER2_BH20VER2_08150 [soil metagenome]
MRACFSLRRLLFVVLLVLLGSSGGVFAAQRIPAQAWRGVQVYDMRELQKLEPLPIRRFVGVRFHYRHHTIRHLKPNWHQGHLALQPRGAGEL